MDNELYQLLLSLKIGDGCYITQSRNRNTYSLKSSSVNADYLKYKKDVLSKFGIVVRDTKCYSGYKKGSQFAGFDTRINPHISKVGQMTKIEVLKNLDCNGLIYYYLDDGSLHKHKNTMHIYCNTFNDEEVQELINILYRLFPIKRCSVHLDKKKDGRVFPYMYLPVCVAYEFSKIVRKFLIENNINSLLYKTISPSQTNKSIE